MMPYEAVYGKRPSVITTYLPGTSKVQSIDKMLQVHTTILIDLKDNLNMEKKSLEATSRPTSFIEGFSGR
jgi:hypothetical protein